jgi:hypothetical protein
VFIQAGKTEILTGTYVALTGSLQVLLDPADVRALGAQWRVDGGAWQNHGVTLSGLVPGSHRVEFQDVPPEESTGCFADTSRSWITPAEVTVTIVAGQTATLTGTYVESGKAVAAGLAGGASQGDMLPLAVLAGLLVASRGQRKTKAQVPRHRMP